MDDNFEASRKDARDIEMQHLLPTRSLRHLCNPFAVKLMLDNPNVTHGIDRPSAELIEKLKRISAATAAGDLHNELGIRDPYMLGPKSFTPGKTIVGPALTLQLLPKREDQFDEGKYVDPEKQLHRHCLYHAQAGECQRGRK